MGYTKTLSFSDIPEGEMRGIQIDSTNVLLINVKGTIHAYEDRCAHKAVALSEGILSDGVLTCHAHFWQYDPETGQSIEPKGSCLKVFKCKVEDGFIFIDID